MRPIQASLLAVLLACGSVHCAGLVPVYDPAAAQAQAQGSVDDAMNQRIAQARVAARQGGPTEAARFAKEVEAVHQSGMALRGKADGPALVREAADYLDRATRAHAEEGPRMQAALGSLLLVTGDKTGAKAALEGSFATPNLWPVAGLLALYDEEGQKDRVTAVCTKARPLVKNDDERFALLDQCAEHAHAASPQAALAWAPKGDVAFYMQRRADEEAEAARENAEHRKKEDADREALYASFSKPGQDQGGSGSAASKGSGGGPVSVTIRSRCSSTVRVFYGTKPKYGSGTTSSVSSNSVSSHTFQPGDMMWTVDGSDNGLSSASISAGTREIEIGPDCSSLRMR
jgi:hypothetical protein